MATTRGSGVFRSPRCRSCGRVRDGDAENTAVHSGRMSRLPFGPSAGKPSGPPSAPRQVTVGQLAAMIDRALKDALPTGVRVVGEIGQFRERTHWYFDLKDADAVISCAMWQSAARKAGFTPRTGQQVVATGRVEFYAKQGRTQFIVDRLEPVGVGALELAYRKLVEELRGLGYFAQDRKRVIPVFPRRVAIVTSRSAAALQDVLDTVGRRCPGLPLALVDVRVQGDGAAEQIAWAIRSIGMRHAELGVDVVLVTRGGGSMEDLWAFNERVVAEAIVASPIPVVAAIGHETDTTIAELVADLRCATPTQAAMRIAPDAAAHRRQLDSIAARLAGGVGRQIALNAERLRGAARHAAFSDPMLVVQNRVQGLARITKDLRRAAAERVQACERRLDELDRRLHRCRPDAEYARREILLRDASARLRIAMRERVRRVDIERPGRSLQHAIRQALAAREAGLLALARGLDLVGPHNVLRRGFTMTLRADGTVLRSAADVGPGELIRTRLADGSITSVVGNESDRVAVRDVPPARARSVKPRRKNEQAREQSADLAREQLDLFGGGG